MEPPTPTAQQVPHTSQTSLQTSVSLTENTNIRGLSTREVIVYSLVSSVFGTVVCVVCVCFYRSKTRQLKKISTGNSENQIHEEENSCYDSYESIDEDAIYDDNVLDDYSEYSENKYNKSESEGSTLNSEKSGYLLPFTSIIPNPEQDEHVYCRGVTSNKGINTSSLLDNEERA
ncbi:unnamed protein product [Mytilus edulis]|uniref:Uncharacterized protein n=1 Tax=Mytilus edulis TaxID=6550 RepID=A0A8S3VHG0_MYTED|nr:unnamed protein product [Mytilus edulis]